ncbi:MAG TPA: bifunctional DNA-binding transcriptional regulator/O6-methylguanine-DNA methyltransferase Ada [Acetobacteraceae bacterium]|jgi:AraC family transcriptional regulator of adaptative response/methylated-DNA-[protein]-cysteine methyltransferase|nr:bifunctional DNA-binding transcriptional regulator/O6-methylguanine-DNA methyltransferase Ada [Acetobacteraceae bacterium]
MDMTLLFPTDAERWQAVMARERRADGAFVYSVRSTGVYCRPSCGARLARRENVRFHASAAAAEAAGFRPCLRCRPDRPDLVLRQEAAVARACRMIETADTPPRLDALARASGLSRFHFHRVFKAATGTTPMAYAAQCRARRMEGALGSANSVTEAIYEAGFNSSGRFYAEAPARLGMTPQKWRAGGTGAVIRYASGACSLGTILVAATEKGLCAISFGEDEKELVGMLAARFPRARLTPAAPDFAGTLAAVIDSVETPARGLDLPLDIQGTAFQCRVWAALKAIPAGETASYAEIARRIGEPGAARAVAAACAANKLAVAIPCHRVIGSDGALSGYRWGTARKRALLAREAGA